MVSTFHGLEIGKRGLAASQASISTTGHNIANANTKGYSRQQVNAVASPSLNVWSSGEVNPSQLGSGVSIESITRVRDQFLDRQYRDQVSALGEWTVQEETLSRLETVVNEPSDTGLRASMDQLSSAWQDLSNDPDSSSAQAVLKERAEAFVYTAQSMDRSMTAAKDGLDRQLTATVTQANQYLEQIAGLNDSIRRSGPQSNDLLDQRDALVEELSKLAAIDVEEQKDGTYTISLRSGGEPIVQGTNHATGNVEQIKADGPAFGGKLAGIVKSMDIVDNYQTQLKDTVKTFAGANGMGLAGDSEETGENLFTKDQENFTVAGLQVNSAINHETPLVLNDEAGFQNARSSYQSLVSELGAESQTAINAVANNDAAIKATDNRRQSVTGVSLDEEMANLIKFQHSYSAAARLISTTDQMLDTIINRMAAR